MQHVELACITFGGMPPYKYQWYRNPVALTNATNNFLIVSNVQPSDAGDYFVVVYDSTPISPDFGFSELSTVTVIPRTNATVLLAASCSTNLQTITATFNQPVTISSPTGADFRIQSINGDVIQFVPLLSAVVTNGTNVHPHHSHYAGSLLLSITCSYGEPASGVALGTFPQILFRSPEKWFLSVWRTALNGATGTKALILE